MECLMIFIEILGYIAIALMLLQIFLTIGLIACKPNENSSAARYESLKVEKSNKSVIHNEPLRESRV